MPLTLYFHPCSQPSRAVLAFLVLNGIEFEPKIINILKKEQKTPEYLKINPLGLVPAIDDDGFTLGESEAIIKYLMSTRKVGEAYYPADPQKRAIVDKYLSFHHSTTRPGLAYYFAAVYSALMGYPLTVEKTKPKAEETCQKLQEFFLKDTKYVAGDELTIADLLAVNELTQLYYTTDFDFNQFPKVKEYIERCLENQVILEANQSVKELPDFAKKYLAGKNQK